MKRIVQSLIRKLGVEIVRYTPPDPNQLSYFMRLMNVHRIDTVIDVGANVGQHAEWLRASGFKGRIISVEPLQKEYGTILEKSANDRNWEVHNLALGKEEGTAKINIAVNSEFSSFLERDEFLKKNIPKQTTYVDTQTVTVKTLDEMFPQWCKPDERVMLKLDVQGFEREVFEGARQTLKSIAATQVECSLQPIYEGEFVVDDFLAIMRKSDFQLMMVKPGPSLPQTGQMLQVDCIFFKPLEETTEGSVV